MKILLIDVNYKYSSTGKIVYDLYTDINKSGNIAAVCYGRGPLVKDPNVIKFSSNIEVYLHALMTRLTGFTGVYSPFATLKLINFIKKFKPDIVHIHELHAYFVNISPVIKYLKKNNIKTIWTFHCEFMYTGKCGHSFECEKWKSECGKCPQNKEYPASYFFDFTKRMFRIKKKLFHDFSLLTIVTPSEWLSNRVKQSFLSNKRVMVIHNGIDTTNIFHPKPYDYLVKKHDIANKKVVLSVAPNLMSELKGGKYVLELADRFINKDIVFLLIGVDKVQDYKDIKQDNVIILGRTKNQAELADYYSMADVFLICSKRENFPTSCLEAICCGSPIIGFDTGGTKEIAPNGYGLFAPYGNINSLENFINELLNGTLKLNSKLICSDFGLNHYSKSIMSYKYLDLYKELHGGKE